MLLNKETKPTQKITEYSRHLKKVGRCNIQSVGIYSHKLNVAESQKNIGYSVRIQLTKNDLHV